MIMDQERSKSIKGIWAVSGGILLAKFYGINFIQACAHSGICFSRKNQ